MEHVTCQVSILRNIPFQGVGGLGFLKQFFMRNRKLHRGLLFHFICFIFSGSFTLNFNFFCWPNLHTNQRCRVAAALPYGVMAFSFELF